MIKLFSVVNLSKESPQVDAVVRSPQLAVLKIKQLLNDGADYIDIGGRSSGSKTTILSDKDEQSRLKLPLILSQQQNISALSLDTWSIETALMYLEHVQVINYTSTYFPDSFLSELANARRKVVVNYLPAKNPYDLRNKPYSKFNIHNALTFFEETLSLLSKRNVEVLAIDPNLGMWHPNTPEQEKPRIQEEIIAHIPLFQTLAPVFIVAPRTTGVLNTELTSQIISQGVNYIRTHDVIEVKKLVTQSRLKTTASI